MRRRIEALTVFPRNFLRYMGYIREILVGLLGLILVGGFMISWLESIDLGDAIYFAFITGLTIGYGDIVPATTQARVVSVAIGLIGMLFTGISIAVATRALADSASQFRDSLEELESPKTQREPSRSDA
jgi:hypothetical protein